MSYNISVHASLSIEEQDEKTINKCRSEFCRTLCIARTIKIIQTTRKFKLPKFQVTTFRGSIISSVGNAGVRKQST